MKRPEKQARGQRFRDGDDKDGRGCAASVGQCLPPPERRRPWNMRGAFAYGEVDTEADKDTRAQLERNLELQKTEGLDGTYRGQAGYKSA